ncbi:MAG: MBL fold metallo-hydrolase [Gemmatimonadaceae bacterium]
MRAARYSAAASLWVALASPLPAQVSFDTVTVRVQPVSGNVYMLVGSGGNIGLIIGDDGAFIVDDQFAPLTDKIRAAIATVTDKPVRFVVNTHWHGDHTGGNERWGTAGSVIIAQENVRKRMSVPQTRNGRTTPASAPKALPVVTFSDSVTMHLNGDSVRVVHVRNAHTDGDALIYYTKANVLHMGDTFFRGAYPFIDSATGGHVDGIIDAADQALGMIRDDTKIIPGHGPLSTKADLQAYRRVVATVRDRVKVLVQQGKSLTDVAATKPTAEFDATYGKGFINPDAFLDGVFRDMVAKYRR